MSEAIRLPRQPETVTPAQARYIADLARQLGYARDAWAADYGLVEETIGGPKFRPLSKVRASQIIADMRTRLGLSNRNG